jgi:predicted nucleic acid-binding protein
VSIVIDASVAASWFFLDERTPESEAVLARVVDKGALVPGLWRLEIASVLQMAIRRGRIASAFRERAIVRLAKLPIAVDSETDSRAWTTILQLSEQYRLTTYDAAYLELAIRSNRPLATRDTELTDAAKKAKVSLLKT